jgi:hypothetical protein
MTVIAARPSGVPPYRAAMPAASVSRNGRSPAMVKTLS